MAAVAVVGYDAFAEVAVGISVVVVAAATGVDGVADVGLGFAAVDVARGVRCCFRSHYHHLWTY